MSSAPRTALITGSARGIGAALARHLARTGWRLVLSYHRSEAQARALERTLHTAGTPEVMFVQADLSDPGQCQALFERAVAWAGVPDAFIHCAGGFHRVDILDETPEGWREMFASNLDGFFYLARLVLPGMLQRRSGRVLAFSLANADRVVAQTQITAHYLSKLALVGLVRGLARRAAAYGVTVNAIGPGFINSGTLDAETQEEAARMVPMGAPGSLEDVLNLALFLLSDEAGYITGASIPLAGGWGL